MKKSAQTVQPIQTKISSTAGNLLQRKESAHRQSNGVPTIVHDVLHSAGQPLATTTRSFMEPRFQHDFGSVRVHSDPQAATSARSVNAFAYTVGDHIVFGAGQYAPNSSAGQRLLAHELTHVLQQRNAGSAAQPQAKLTINPPGDAFEQEADAMAANVVAGTHTSQSFTRSPRAIQRETPTGESEQKPKNDAGAVIGDGLATVAEQVKDNNPQVKKVIIDPLKEKAKGRWDQLSTGEKVATISFGVATLGIGGGALLGDPKGRKQLEGVNLAAPLTLIPYMPLTSFKYTLPTGDSADKRLLKFETSFNADDLINLRTSARGLPKMSLGVNLQWGFDPLSDRLSVLGGDASLGVVPGLSLSAGAYKDVLRPSPTALGTEGQLTQSRKSLPEFGQPQPIPDVRIMINVDLLKFKPGDLKRQIQNLF